ncbi:MAG: hypothetical protein MHPSP_003112 [Paramarteilia canceri]
MKRGKLDKMFLGRNLGPVKNSLPCDNTPAPKIYYPKHSMVAIRRAGAIPAESQNVETGGISGCAAQLSRLIDCLRENEGVQKVCSEEIADVERCRVAVRQHRASKMHLKQNTDIEGDLKNVTHHQVNRLLKWFPSPEMPRGKFDNKYNNFYINYGYFKRRGSWKPSD